MNLSEIEALIELASRAPKSASERLWLNALIERIKREMDAQRTQQSGATNSQDAAP